jgi:hypothetical protein
MIKINQLIYTLTGWLILLIGAWIAMHYDFMIENTTDNISIIGNKIAIYVILPLSVIFFGLGIKEKKTLINTILWKTLFILIEGILAFGYISFLSLYFCKGACL